MRLWSLPWLCQRPHTASRRGAALFPGAGSPAMSGRRDQLHQAGISIVGFQETRRRGQVTGSCRGFGVFPAAADKAGHGGVELWIRQDIMGDPKSFHMLVAEPRLLLVKSHTAAGVIQFCECHGPDNTRDQAEIQAWWRRAAAVYVRSLYRSSCYAMPMRGWDRLIRRRIGRTRLARSFIPCSWSGTCVFQLRCQARTTTQPSLPERVPPGCSSRLVCWCETGCS